MGVHTTRRTHDVYKELLGSFLERYLCKESFGKNQDVRPKLQALPLGVVSSNFNP